MYQRLTFTKPNKKFPYALNSVKMSSPPAVGEREHVVILRTKLNSH